MPKANLSRLMQSIVLAALLIGCSKKASSEIDFGTFNKSVYTNGYFGLTVTLPADWSVQDQAAQKRQMELGGKILAGDDKTMNTVMKAAELQTVNLFSAHQFPLGSPTKNNPAVMGVAEKVSQLPGIKRGKDYLFQVRQILEGGQIKTTFPKEIYTEQLGGVDFDVQDLQLAVRGTTVNEKYYCTISKGYALSFILVYTSDEESPDQRKILDSVTFK